MLHTGDFMLEGRDDLREVRGSVKGGREKKSDMVMFICPKTVTLDQKLQTLFFKIRILSFLFTASYRYGENQSRQKLVRNNFHMTTSDTTKPNQLLTINYITVVSL